jgi:hypothetical protein
MHRASLLALAAAGALTSLSAAAADGELNALRAEIAQLKQAYETRIAALEARLEKAEAQAARPAPLAATPAAVPAPVATSARAAAGSGFNPQLSLILDGVYFRDNRKGASAELYEHIDGINHGHGHEGHDHGALERGFNLRETELAFSAAVSPYFDASVLMTVSSEGSVELEEAYFDTRALPAGLKLRGGKFLSGIGYLNSQHPHQWDFVDQNLPYRTLLGDHGLADTGLRLTWLPPTGNWYTQLGVELLQGREQTFASAGEQTPTGRADGGALAATSAGEFATAKAGPRLTTVFARLAPDLGDRHALQLGLWGARARQHQEVHDHTAEEPDTQVHALEGKASVWGGDLVYKYDAGGYGGVGNLKLVAEYLRQKKDLQVAFHENGDLVGQPRNFVQDGFLVQATYGFAPHWQAGLRYDATGMTNRLDGAAGRLWDQDKSDRWTVALTRQLTEFSLLRLQASRAKLWVEGVEEGVNQLFLQYQHSLGAHGAHSF